MMRLNRAPLRTDRATGKPLPPTAFTSFGMAAPVRTHFIELPCSVAQCRGYVHGWTTILDPMRSEHLPFIRHIVDGVSGRRWSRGPITPEGYLTFVFPPGQSCFANSHHTRNHDVAELYLVRGGDHRMPYGRRNPVLMNFDNWREALDKNQTALIRGHEAMRE